VSEVLCIHGVVTRGGSPVEGVYADLIAPDGLFVAERRTGPDGRYEFHTTPGAWEIAFRAAGADPVRRSVDSTGEVELDVELAAR